MPDYPSDYDVDDYENQYEYHVKRKYNFKPHKSEYPVYSQSFQAGTNENEWKNRYGVIVPMATMEVDYLINALRICHKMGNRHKALDILNELMLRFE